MRGSLPDFRGFVRDVGIIPAHAGLTGVEFDEVGRQWDHPRACGAHACMARQNGLNEGSSPRMRGSQIIVLFRSSGKGIIPAHAGLTRHFLGCCLARWDHPRACGAHRGIERAVKEARGSSPRMRGSQALRGTI